MFGTFALLATLSNIENTLKEFFRKNARPSIRPSVRPLAVSENVHNS